MKIDESELLQADDLVLPEVGSWAKEKHRKVAYYCSLFSKSMKNKWDCRVYIDLFASAGKGKIRATEEIILGSPLLALNLDLGFDRHLFCESDDASMQALQARVARHFPDAECAFVQGDTNDNVQAILSAVPAFNKDFKGLSLCFVDPYKKGELHFSTIEQIASNLYVDFLVLIPSFMDINRNLHNYTRVSDHSLDIYLGTDAWRAAWESRSRSSQSFGLFIADQFGLQMQRLGFIYEGLEDMELVRMGSDQNLPLYHLAFFSKNQRGLTFWRETVKRTNDQLRMPFS